MNPLKSKHYPKIMYLALIVVSLLLLFNTVNILENANNKIKEKSLTGFAIQTLEKNTSINNSANLSVEKITVEKELYSSKAYTIFYIFLIGILTAIALTFLILRSTVNKNIKLEEKEREF